MLLLPQAICKLQLPIDSHSVKHRILEDAKCRKLKVNERCVQAELPGDRLRVMPPEGGNANLLAVLEAVMAVLPKVRGRGVTVGPLMGWPLR